MCLTFSSRSSSLSSKSSCCRHHSYSTWTWALNFPASAWFNYAYKHKWLTALVWFQETICLQAEANTRHRELTSSSHCRCFSLRAISSGVSPASLAEGKTTETYNRCCILMHMSTNTRPIFFPPILIQHEKCVIRLFPTLNNSGFSSSSRSLYLLSGCFVDVRAEQKD